MGASFVLGEEYIDLLIERNLIDPSALLARIETRDETRDEIRYESTSSTSLESKEVCKIEKSRRSTMKASRRY